MHLQVFLYRVVFFDFKLKNVIKHISLSNILTALSVFFVIYILRTYVLSDIYLILVQNLHIYIDLLFGTLVVFVRLLFLGFWQEILRAIWPGHLSLDAYTSKKANSLSSTDSNKNVNQKPNKEELTEVKDDTNDKNLDPEATVYTLSHVVKEDTKDLIEGLSVLTGYLNDRNKIFSPEKFKDPVGYEKFLVEILKDQSNNFTKCVNIRMSWVQARSVNCLVENQSEIRQIHTNLLEIQKNYWSKLKDISKIDNEVKQAKELYANLNHYRNLALKELNKADEIILKDIRTSDLNKYPELKKVLNAEYTQAKKEFNTQDGYLRMRISEILNAKKNNK